MQDGRGGLGIGTDLAGGRPQGVARLDRVPALGSLATRLAASDVNAELADQRRAGDLGLELVNRAGLDEATAAVGAGVGQVRLVALGDLIELGRWTVAVLAVGIAGLAAGRLRVGLGRPLAERGGLPLPGAEGILQLPGQLRDPGFEFGDTLEEFPTAGTRGLVHDTIVANGGRRRPDEGLIKYAIEHATCGIKQQFRVEQFLVRTWRALRRLLWLVAWSFWWLNL